MPQPLTANDLLPLVAHLTPDERVRLVHLIEAAFEHDAAIYARTPPKPEEFSSDEDLLGWDGEGWEHVA